MADGEREEKRGKVGEKKEEYVAWLSQLSLHYFGRETVKPSEGQVMIGAEGGRVYFKSC